MSLKKRKFRPSVWVPLALFVYSACIYAYTWPWPGESLTKVGITAGVNVLIIAGLAVLLRRKEQFKARREEDMMNSGRGR